MSGITSKFQIGDRVIRTVDGYVDTTHYIKGLTGVIVSFSQEDAQVKLDSKNYTVSWNRKYIELYSKLYEALL